MIKGKQVAGVAITIVIMTIFLLLGLFLGYPYGDETQPDKIKEIHVWGSVPESAGPAKMIANFNKAYKGKGIRAEYYYYDNTEGGNQGLETTILSGSNVDVYFTYDIAILQKRAEGNMAIDFSNYLKKDQIDLKSYYNVDVSSCYINKKPYSIPTKLDQYGIVINKDMFDAAGIDVPTEWDYDEFMEIAKKLTHGEGKDKVYGMFFCSQQNFGYFIDFFAPCSMGGNPLYNKDTGLSNFNSKEMKNLVGMAYRMMKIDESAPSHEDSVIQKLTQESMFLSGRCAMTIGPWIIRSVKDEANFPHDFTTAFAPYPVEDKNSQNYSQVRLGDYLSVSPYSKYKEESWEFVKWYTTEGILPLVEGGRIPAYKGFDVKEITEILLKNGGNSIDRESAVRVLIEPKDDYAVATNTNKLSRLYHISNDMFEKIMTDEVGIEEGIKEAQKKGDEVLR